MRSVSARGNVFWPDLDGLLVDGGIDEDWAAGVCGWFFILFMCFGASAGFLLSDSMGP
jgi:hypothetical protein